MAVAEKSETEKKKRILRTAAAILHTESAEMKLTSEKYATAVKWMDLG